MYLGYCPTSHVLNFTGNTIENSAVASNCWNHKVQFSLTFDDSDSSCSLSAAVCGIGNLEGYYIGYYVVV